MPGKFAAATEGQSDYLANTIDVQSGLYLKLLDRHILNRQQVDLCKAEKTSFEQARKLLEFLWQCDDKHFDNFCKSLSEIGQSHIVQRLQENLLKAQAAGDASHGSDLPYGLKKRQHVTTNNDHDVPGTPRQHSMATKSFSWYGMAVVISGAVIVVALVVVCKGVQRDVWGSGNIAQQKVSTHSFTDMFKGRKRKLMDQIAVSPEFWALLDDKSLLTSSQIEDCKKQHMNDDKVDCVLKYLEKRDSTRIPQFCDLLKETDQPHVIEILPSGYCEV